MEAVNKLGHITCDGTQLTLPMTPLPPTVTFYYHQVWRWYDYLFITMTHMVLKTC